MYKKLHLFIKSQTFKQLLSYGLVVAIAFPIDIGCLWLFTDEFHFYYVLSATLAFTISMTVNYFLSTTWVFTSRSKHTKSREVFGFFVIGFIGLGLTDLFLWIFTSLFDVYYLYSKLLVVLLVFFWSFFARKYLIFNDELLPTKE